MKKVIMFLFAMALVVFPRLGFAQDSQGLRLGGLDKDAKKAKIEAKKTAKQAEVEAKKAQAQAKKEAEQKLKEAEKA
ncbi:MAG TPA: hypothetical protein PLO93_06440, partial [Candidatus Omnitrophota bacterium]|nr:hypothetical protein [Candidatus Omnitrophota bacterium]